MPEVLEAVKLAVDAVEKIKNDGIQHFPVAANIGDAVRQGDIYIQLIDPVETTPPFFIKVTSPTFPFQLAPGNTKGSRHCLEHSDGIEIYTPETSLLQTDESDIEMSMRRSLREKIYTHAKTLSETNVSGPQAFEINDDLVNTLNFSGPIFTLKNATTVSHPEHGDWVLPAGTYRCVFQRTVDVENTIRRVLD